MTRTSAPTHSPGKQRYQETKRITLIGGGLDLVLGILKIAVGKLSFSQSLVADGVHSLSDLVTDVLVAASCDRFIGNGNANPSCMVDFLMEGDETKKHLFLPNQNRRRFLSLYED